MKFTPTHEWIKLEDDVGTVGVTHFAQKELGDIVYVELPSVGKEVKEGEEGAVLESTKAAADVYFPVSGTVLEVNQTLTEKPELINNSPEADGWIFKIKLANPKELDSLMEAEAYYSLLK